MSYKISDNEIIESIDEDNAIIQTTGKWCENWGSFVCR